MARLDRRPSALQNGTRRWAAKCRCWPAAARLGEPAAGCSRGNRLVLAYTATTRPIEPPDRRRPGGGDVAPCHRVRGMRRSRGQPAYTPHLRPCRCATLRRAAVHPPAVAADARPTIGLGLAEPIPAARRRCHGCGASAGSGRSESVGHARRMTARDAQPVSYPPRRAANRRTLHRRTGRIPDKSVQGVCRNGVSRWCCGHQGSGCSCRRERAEGEGS